MNKISKRHVTLLEVLIAMALLSILMVAIMGFYSQVESIHQEVTKTRKKAFYLLYAQHRLNDILPRAEIAFNNDTYWFYTPPEEGEFPSLVFVYDNDVDGNLLFANKVLSKLYVEKIDGKNRLILATWPLPKRHPSANAPMRKEVLLDGVTDLSFFFYRPPRREKEDRPIDPQEEEITNRWTTQWPIDLDKLPPIMKVVIGIEGEEPIQMSFVLPKSEETILYTQ